MLDPDFESMHSALTPEGRKSLRVTPEAENQIQQRSDTDSMLVQLDTREEDRLTSQLFLARLTTSLQLEFLRICLLLEAIFNRDFLRRSGTCG